jgi:hypothetical protein
MRAGGADGQEGKIGTRQTLGLPPPFAFPFSRVWYEAGSLVRMMDHKEWLCKGMRSNVFD